MSSEKEEQILPSNSEEIEQALRQQGEDVNRLIRRRRFTRFVRARNSPAASGYSCRHAACDVHCVLGLLYKSICHHRTETFNADADYADASDLPGTDEPYDPAQSQRGFQAHPVKARRPYLIM